MGWCAPVMGTKWARSHSREIGLRRATTWKEWSAGTGLNRRHQDFQSWCRERGSPRKPLPCQGEPVHYRARECAGIGQSGPEMGTIWAQPSLLSRMLGEPFSAYRRIAALETEAWALVASESVMRTRSIRHFSMEVHRRVTGVIGRWRRRVLAPKALQPRPRLDQRAIDGEVVRGQQVPRLRLGHHALRKSRGQEAQLAYQGHVLMEHRNGLAVDACVTQAVGIAEREAAAAMASNLRTGATLAGDKGYDTAGFVAVLRHRQITPHVAQNTANRRSAIDGRTTRHPGYAISQQKRKRVEEIFGWAKTVGLFRQTRHRGVRRVGWMFTFALAVYNLVRIRNLTWATP